MSCTPLAMGLEISSTRKYKLARVFQAMILRFVSLVESHGSVHDLAKLVKNVHKQ